MSLMEKLLSRLPVKYHDRVIKIESEYGLVDDCKYVIYCSNQYKDCEGLVGVCYPVRSITDAIHFIKELEHI